jgi:flagellar motor switch/type III secretory pathway protein FliN
MNPDESELTLNNAATPPQHEASLRRLQAVPLRLAVTIPVPGMKLRDLRILRIGKVLTTVIPAAEDVAVRVGGALLGWAELDSADGRMAIRLTRLS